MSEAKEDGQRKEREKEFHNKTFSLDGGRTEGSQFYTVTEPSSDAFEAEILCRAVGRTVLEYGCGPGTHSFRLAKVAKRVIGIDISEVAIELARRRAVERGVDNVEFHVMDAESLTFPDASFDLVCGRAIVHHLDVRRCFSTISRVLHPGEPHCFRNLWGTTRSSTSTGTSLRSSEPWTSTLCSSVTWKWRDYTSNAWKCAHS